MTSESGGSSKQNLDADISSLDLECISFKVVWDEKWSLREVDDVELQYRWFLQAIRARVNEPLAPPKAVDVYWHHHILDTQKYVDDCNVLFGRYIHHFPYTGVFGEKDEAAQMARSLRYLEFVQRLKQS